MIILKVIAGSLPQMEYSFDVPTICILGRARDCMIQFPTLSQGNFVSRYHCMFDITPPRIRIKDLGSRNGTFLNGVKIGQRNERKPSTNPGELETPEYELQNGDEIKLGEVVLKVGIQHPVACLQFSGQPQKLQRCGKCDKEISRELTPGPSGEVICKHCREDPRGVVESLLQKSQEGKACLFSIKGFRILKELGKGGMGSVFLAEREHSGEKVALKIMLPRIASDETAKRVFLREIENTKALCHQNVICLKESGIFDGIYFFTLEYCNLGSVDGLMAKSGGKLPIQVALEIIRQALDGLEYAHNAEIPNVLMETGKVGKGKGLVHRDIKPSNIFLSSVENSIVAKIGDFGISKAFDFAGLTGITTTGAHLGCFHYCPKILLFNYRYAKPEVDVWAMAATLYHMLSGYLPREFPEGKDIFKIILSSSPIPILKRNPEIPKKLAAVIDEALLDRQILTFETAAEFKNALQEAFPVSSQ